MKCIIRFLLIVCFVVYFTSCNNDKGNLLAFIPPDLSRAESMNIVEISRIEKEATRYWNIAVKDSFIVFIFTEIQNSKRIRIIEVIS